MIELSPEDAAAIHELGYLPSSMKMTVLVLCLLSAPFYAVNGEDSRPWRATVTIERINEQKQIEGYWALAPAWEGYMGLALELRNGKFRYWFLSDSGPSGREPEFPFTGAFTIEHGILVLKTNQEVYDTRWLLITHKGKRGLFPFSAFETITMRRESPLDRMLFRITEAEAKAEWPRYTAPPRATGR